ncbi:outer membrane beta-barrel protein [Vibrio sp. vnigr-6D03]|uniref:outer membrane protein n=1 Tax=Vibrio sp. vnigr-6D03 TaxID=2058088 RepID=UPI000C336394|nr:outer membrane beta-barrel protein [Vibrio sp. vnigr-6D03]
MTKFYLPFLLLSMPFQTNAYEKINDLMLNVKLGKANLSAVNSVENLEGTILGLGITFQTNEYTGSENTLIGFEMGMEQFSESGETVDFAGSKMQSDVVLNTFSLSPVFTYIPMQNIQLYGKAGLGFAFGTIQGSNPLHSGSIDMYSHGASLGFGVGARYQIKRILLGIEYTKQDFTSTFSSVQTQFNGKGRINSLMLSASYQF